MPHLHVVVPGDIDTPTGGYAYDRRLIAGLRDLGWQVELVALPGTYPYPGPLARGAARQALATLPTGACVLIDGLAGGALPDELAREATRLRIVALVHHALADETGLHHGTAALAASERAALASARAVICTGARTATRLACGFSVEAGLITVAPPGTDPAPRKAPRMGVPPRILAVGSLTSRKRHDVLIAALARLAELPWQARIVGSAELDPACADRLRAQVESVGLEDQVVMAGAVPDARAEYDAADIFALASVHEGYGMAFAEALRHGLPVVGARSDAVADLVPAGAGALVPRDDPAAMAAALARLLRDPDAADDCAEAAWHAGAALPSWDDTAGMVAAALERVMP